MLRAEWRMLAMLSWAIDPRALSALVPAGCELDSFGGRTLLSLVGFQFRRTRLLGVPALLHAAFEEVNLRFYVRRKVVGEWRRGVVFLRELVPRRAVAWLANAAYGEHYTALPMRHEERAGSLAYEWRKDGPWEGFRVAYAGEPSVPAEDAEETFITEHYWGYTARPGGGAFEYRVEHPRWRQRRQLGATPRAVPADDVDDHVRVATAGEDVDRAEVADLHGDEVRNHLAR